MAIDFNNYPIWASGGTKTQPGFLSAGFSCGIPLPEHTNWWWNRTDQALLDLDGRVSTNTTNIANLTTTVNGLSNSLVVSGLLGVYVSDSDFAASTSVAGTWTTIKTFSHTIQNTGDVFLEIGADIHPHLSPLLNQSDKHCIGDVQVRVNGNVMIASVYGHTHANPSNNITQVYGIQQLRRLINVPFNPAYFNKFGVFSKNDVVTIDIRARLFAGHKGSLGLGFVKLIAKEYRAFDI